MKASLLSLVALLASSSVLAADSALVLRDDGYYVLNPGDLHLTKIALVVDQRNAGGGGPGDPGGPGGDTLSERAKAIATLSAGVGTREEAVALSAVAQAVAGEYANQKAWDTAFTVSLNRISGGISPAWAAWKTKVDALAGDFNKSFFDDVAAGLSNVHGVDLGEIRNLAAGDKKANVGLEPDSAIDLIAIMELIKFIMDLLEQLKDSGLFNSTSSLWILQGINLLV